MNEKLLAKKVREAVNNNVLVRITDNGGSGVIYVEKVDKSGLVSQLMAVIKEYGL